jgi:hypothetical protein
MADDASDTPQLDEVRGRRKSDARDSDFGAFLHDVFSAAVFLEIPAGERQIRRKEGAHTDSKHERGRKGMRILTAPMVRLCSSLHKQSGA